MLQVYVSVCCCDNAVLMICLGSGTKKNTASGWEKITCLLRILALVTTNTAGDVKTQNVVAMVGEKNVIACVWWGANISLLCRIHARRWHLTLVSWTWCLYSAHVFCQSNFFPCSEVLCCIPHCSQRKVAGGRPKTDAGVYTLILHVVGIVGTLVSKCLTVWNS